MINCVTTVDILGDNAVTDGLIDGSLTEYIDNIAGHVGSYVFHSDRLSNLEKVCLPNVTSVSKYSFRSCRAKEIILPSIRTIDSDVDYFGYLDVEKIDFTALNKIHTASSQSISRPFRGCKTKAFIIRNPNMCTIENSYDPFIYSSIGQTYNGETGYIYVPKNLVESYKSASIWSNHADYIRAIEDYPEICSNGAKIWSRSNVKSGNFYSLHYANGLFVASKNASKEIKYSSDGVNWEDAKINNQTGNSNYQFYSRKIDYLNNMWVLCSGLSYFGYSNDGINWNVITMSTDDIIYVNNMFYIAGGNGVYYSSDCVNWTQSNLTSDVSFITYGNNIFVACGSSGFYYSTDGINWTKSGTLTSGRALYYHNGLFVATIYSMSTYYGFYYSTDGINWTKNSQFASNDGFDCCVYLNELWLSGRQTRYNSYGIYYSTDGINWTQSDLTTGELKDIIYVNGLYVATLNIGIYYSTDGIHWSKSNVYNFDHVNSRIRFGNNTYVVAMDVKGLIYSNDMLI